MRCATSLRVLLMLVCSSTLLRDVLLSWISYSEASRPLNCVPSKPAVPQTRVSRVGIEEEFVLAAATSRASAQVRPARRKLAKPEGAVLGRDHVVGVEACGSTSRSRVAGSDGATDVERSSDGAGHQLVAFELHLPARHVERWR